MEKLYFWTTVSVICMSLAIPILSQGLDEIPSDLTFNCEGRPYGYYADVSTSCQVFHICLGDGDVKWSFLCPNQTMFSQELFICDYEFNVDCENSPLRYNLNSNFGVTTTQKSREIGLADVDDLPLVRQETVIDQLKEINLLDENPDVGDTSLFDPAII